MQHSGLNVKAGEPPWTNTTTARGDNETTGFGTGMAVGNVILYRCYTLRVKGIPVQRRLHGCNRLASPGIFTCTRDYTLSAADVKQPAVLLLPLLRVVGTPGSIGTLGAMTRGPPVPFAAVAEERSHTEASSDPQSEPVYPTRTGSFGHFFQNGRTDEGVL